MREVPILIFFVVFATSQARPGGGYSYPQHQQQLQLPQQISILPQQHNLYANQPQILPQVPSLPAPVISQAPLPQPVLGPPLQQNTHHLLPVTSQIGLNQNQQSVTIQQNFHQLLQPLRQPVFQTAPGPHILSQQEQFAGPSQLIQGQTQVAQLDISQLPIQPNQILIPSLQAPQVQQGFNAPQIALQQPALPQAGPTVTKHIYVHVAPEEPPLSPQNIPPPPPPRKHHKIIFIKAPSQTTYQQQVIQSVPTPAVEEKTLIYVLVKEPQRAELVVHQSPPVQPSKPEVYFVKYKSKSEGSTPSDVSGAVSSQVFVDNNSKNEPNRLHQINSGESTSSLISGGLPVQGIKYGPPKCQKRNA